MPRKSKAEAEEPAAEAVEETVEAPAAPEARFVVRQVPASSDSGFGFDVFDNELAKRVDGPFRDEDAAVARARKREIRG